MSGRRRATPGRPTQRAARADRRQARLSGRMASARTPQTQLAAAYDYAREVIAALSRTEPGRAGRLAHDLTTTLIQAARAADSKNRR
jgi:hypothetical protein